MPTIGITGHMNLTPATVELVRDAIGDALTRYAAGGELAGVSCIAPGADSIFAEALLDLGGALTVILPAADYRDRKFGPDHAERFDRLVAKATTVQVMPFDTSNRHAYQAANEALLAASNVLLAVWDGQAPADHGGTAATIDTARSAGLPVEVIWPPGAART